MKFITETDLRGQYKRDPFEAYEVKENTRLTPEARQFLNDRGVKITSQSDKTSAIKSGEEAKDVQKQGISSNDLCSKKLLCVMKSTSALFLVTAEELLQRDILLSQKVMDLGRQLRDIMKSADGSAESCELVCEECTGIKQANFSDDLGDCFEITEFHIQLEKGREIALLHRLRCVMREVQLTINEAFYSGQTDDERSRDLIKKTNQIINTLSHMICLSVGGSVCQR